MSIVYRQTPLQLWDESVQCQLPGNRCRTRQCRRSFETLLGNWRSSIPSSESMVKRVQWGTELGTNGIIIQGPTRWPMFVRGQSSRMVRIVPSDWTRNRHRLRNNAWMVCYVSSKTGQGSRNSLKILTAEGLRLDPRKHSDENMKNMCWNNKTC